MRVSAWDYEEIKSYLGNMDSLNEFRNTVAKLETDALENGDFASLRLASVLKDVVISKLLGEKPL